MREDLATPPEMDRGSESPKLLSMNNAKESSKEGSIEESSQEDSFGVFRKEHSNKVWMGLRENSRDEIKRVADRRSAKIQLKSLILAQNERWRRA